MATNAYDPSAQQQRSLSERAQSAWETTKREATPPRLAAAGAVALGAAAVGYLWDAGRRERFTTKASDLSSRVSDKLGMSRQTAPSASEITIQ